MRILNLSTNEPLESVCIYLTPSEAKQMAGFLEDLISGEAKHHAHIDDDAYEREITVAVYTPNNLEEFDDRSRRLILEGT